MSDKIENGAGAPPRRNASPVRPEGGPTPTRPAPFRHLAHLPSCRDNPIVFFTTCTYQRARILASPQCDKMHFFARPAIDARPLADWVQMWKSVSSRRIAAALAIDPPIWQTDYFDRYLRSSESYSKKWHYVEQNAVRAHLVETVEAWPSRGTIHDLMF